MTENRYGNWLTIGTNISVLIGIALIVVELKQNQDTIRGQTRNDLFQGSADVISLTAESSELADIVVRSNQGEPLTAAENYMYNSRSELVFRYWENTNYQYRQGLYDEGEFSKHRKAMKALMRANAGLVRFWCNNRELFSTPFAIDIDEMLRGTKCED